VKLGKIGQAVQDLLQNKIFDPSLSLKLDLGMMVTILFYYLFIVTISAIFRKIGQSFQDLLH